MIDVSGIPPGDIWSNRQERDPSLFKNYGVECISKVSLGTRLKTICKFMCSSHDKPAKGYEAFFKEWHTPCRPREVLQRLLDAPPPASGERRSDAVFWLGHASQLVCLVNEGVNLLMDPIFSPRASPFRHLGPKRCFPPPLQVEDLPPIHVVCISHNHYDHMDSQTIRDLYRCFPSVIFCVPLNMESLMKPWGIPASSIVSLDWWEEAEMTVMAHSVTRPAVPGTPATSLAADGGGLSRSNSNIIMASATGRLTQEGPAGRSLVLRIACTPAQHYGLHSLFDRNRVLWCGWCVGWRQGSITTPSPLHRVTVGKQPSADTPSSQMDWTWDHSALKSYYFTGDTSFTCPAIFEQIHYHYPRISMAGLPIGAYKPREMLRAAHVDPQNAVDIYYILHVQRAFGLHWGTFELGMEPIDEPPAELQEALKEASTSQVYVREEPVDFTAIRTGDHLLF